MIYKNMSPAFIREAIAYGESTGMISVSPPPPKVNRSGKPRTVNTPGQPTKKALWLAANPGKTGKDWDHHRGAIWRAENRTEYAPTLRRLQWQAANPGKTSKDWLRYYRTEWQRNNRHAKPETLTNKINQPESTTYERNTSKQQLLAAAC